MDALNNAGGNGADRFPGATLIRTNPDGTRIWRQRPINFANHRTVAEVDAGQLVSRTNDIFIPIAAAPSAGEGGRPAATPCGGSLANVSDHHHEVPSK